MQRPYANSHEALIVELARRGNRDAFAELVQRRQAWIRTLMRRCCADADLADDLAQQVFFQAWRDIARLRDPKKFGAWLKRLAINTWHQHLRKNDPLADAEPAEALEASQHTTNPGIAMDLDQALQQLSPMVRTCVVLAYHEGMTHGEITDATGLPLGTVKSHVRRGGLRLQEQLSAYQETENTND